MACTQRRAPFRSRRWCCLSNRRLARNRFQVRTQSDPCISSVATAIMITTSNSSVKRSRRSDKIRLAVLPFENLTGDPKKEYLADGLTEETISQLGRLNPEQLGVIARTSVMGYKHKNERLDQIGRELSVQYVLENSLRESGNHLRLTAQLIQVKDQTHLWTQDYD